jgi:glycine cleavage system H protein
VEFPKDLFYTKDHEWVKVENGIATIGITGYAAEQLGDIVFVEVPPIDEEVAREDSIGIVESVKTVSDIYAPISGTVFEHNQEVLAEINGNENENFHPEYLNEDPYNKGWIVKIKLTDENELKKLLSVDEYAAIAK